MTTNTLQERAINTLRLLSADAVQQANSGHPGLPMGAAAMAYTIWTRHLRHYPKSHLPLVQRVSPGVSRILSVSIY